MPTKSPYNMKVVKEADSAADRAIKDFLSGEVAQRGVHVTAPAGAGKSYLISRAVGQARARQLRVAVAAPTNEQAFGLVRTIATLYGGTGSQTITFVPARSVSLPVPATH